MCPSSWPIPAVPEIWTPARERTPDSFRTAHFTVGHNKTSRTCPSIERHYKVIARKDQRRSQAKHLIFSSRKKKGNLEPRMAVRAVGPRELMCEGRTSRCRTREQMDKKKKVKRWINQVCIVQKVTWPFTCCVVTCVRRAFFPVFKVTCEGSQGNNGKEVICFFAQGDEMGFFLLLCWEISHGHVTREPLFWAKALGKDQIERAHWLRGTRCPLGTTRYPRGCKVIEVVS